MTTLKKKHVLPSKAFLQRPSNMQTLWECSPWPLLEETKPFRVGRHRPEMQPKNQDQDWAWKSYSRSGDECQIDSEIKTKKEGESRLLMWLDTRKILTL